MYRTGWIIPPPSATCKFKRARKFVSSKRLWSRRANHSLTYCFVGDSGWFHSKKLLHFYFKEKLFRLIAYLNWNFNTTQSLTLKFLLFIKKLATFFTFSPRFLSMARTSVRPRAGLQSCHVLCQLFGLAHGGWNGRSFFCGQVWFIPKVQIRSICKWLIGWFTV